MLQGSGRLLSCNIFMSDKIMTKYLVNRILRGICSIIIVIGIVMMMIYGIMDRNLIFAKDSQYTKTNNNQKITYKYQTWENYGYLDYVTFSEYLQMLLAEGEIDEETMSKAVTLSRKAENDSDLTKEYVQKFNEYYKSQGYTVKRLDAVMASPRKVASGGNQALFAYRDVPLFTRLGAYLRNLVQVDSIHNVENIVGERGITFTLHDPAYGGEKFSPAIMGNGTTNRYLLYFDDQFPYLHQNIIKISLGTSYSVNLGVDVFDTMNQSQGSFKKSTITYPTGLVAESADNLHTATYVEGSRDSLLVLQDRYVDDYTNVSTSKSGFSKVGYSFVIGIMSILLAYFLGVPLGIVMARNKDKLVDKILTCYIVFIIAVPSLAYIFLFKAIGGELGLPTTFDMDAATKLVFVLPVVSLALRSIADLMKWMRRYMIDQMNSDYVKFARSGGLSENEIFTKHVLKNAIIPIVHGIPGSLLVALTGAIITERVYVVPGAGNLLTKAINTYDNGVIIGVTLFYAVISVLSVILGDILISMVDPRISFSSKDR